MPTWKKVLLWTTGILVVTVGGCFAITDRLFSDMCATTVFDEISSPSQKLKAVVFQIDCGATSDFNTQVAIVKASFNTSEAKFLPKSFFVAHRDNGRAPAGISKGPEVRLNWQSDDELRVQYHQFARVLRSENRQGGVTIQYQTFQ